MSQLQELAEGDAPRLLCEVDCRHESFKATLTAILQDSVQHTCMLTSQHA